MQLFQQQLGNLEDEENNSNVNEPVLKDYLSKKGYSDSLISKALFEFKKVVTINSNDDLYQANKAVYCLEYIIVHELIHLIERHHNDNFLALMNKYLPQWKSYKVELNRLPMREIGSIRFYL